MVSPTSSAPALMSAPRIATLLTALLVSLSSGTNYVYSAYAPQLGARLHISHTQLNVIALAGNVGVYSTGPIWGKIVDSHGPRILLVSAFFLLLAGYSGIRRIYDAGLPDSAVTLSTLSFLTLTLFGWMTGAGSNGGLAASMNATAKSFPDKARATTTGLVISGFGLSALAFSTAAHVAFPGSTSSFLLLLALGTSLPMILGFFLVRPIPLPSHDVIHTIEHGAGGYHRVADSTGVETPLIFERGNDSQTHLLTQDAPAEVVLHHAHGSSYAVPQAVDAVELSPARTFLPRLHEHSHSPSAHPRSHSPRVRDSLPDVHGRQMLRSKDFWLLFTVMSLLSGTGLMWINNVGSIAQALFAKGNPEYDEVAAAQWQSAQVSTVSFTNFLGRILIGLLSDYTKNELHFPRSYCVCLVSVLFIMSQAIATSVSDVHDLWKASAVLGLAYGSMFGLFPTVSLEFFGLAHFSENWGYLSMSPLFGGNLFSLAFGRNLDAHASPESVSSPVSASALARRAGLPSIHQCFEGRACYIESLHLTIASCLLALALSVWAAWRERAKARGKDREVVEEIVWDQEEEE